VWDPRRRIDRFAVGLRVQRRVPVEVGNQAETSVLFELIAERYERKSIAITANAPSRHGTRCSLTRP
jgi:hypothetical protein